MSVLSIAEAARRLLNSSPCVMDCMQQGIINYTALAKTIREEVQKLTKREKISLNAIKMALIRYAEELENSRKLLERRVARVLGRSVLELKNDVTIITVKQQALVNIGKVVKRMGGFRFFQFTQGTKTFTIVVDQRECPTITRLIEDEYIVMSIKDQSAILLISPEEVIHAPGVIAYITTLLARNNVNITQIISCYVDTIFIVKRSDALKAYNILEQQILNLRHQRGE